MTYTNANGANNVDFTLFADVSEFQPVVDNSYTDAGYRWISIRANDGSYLDHNFAANYQWCVQAANDGRLDGFIVYAYWRPNWQTTAAALMGQVKSQGGPHPKMVAMLDIESGSGNPSTDQSEGINGTYGIWSTWLGPARVIGYGNASDLDRLWPHRPANVALILAAYGSDPNYPGQFAHQYTDGTGYGGGLPEGAPPFVHCDMNSSDGLSSMDMARLLGVAPPPPPPPPVAPPPPPPPPPVASAPPALPDDDTVFAAAGAIWSQFTA